MALLATDDLVLVVNGTSEIQDIEEFIAYAQENDITIAGTGTVNVDFIVPTLFAQEAGFEFEYVSFNSMADQTTALLSQSVDAMVGNPGEILGLIDSGDLRPLVYSGDFHPRGAGRRADHGRCRLRHRRVDAARPMILPPDGPAKRAQDFWIETMQRVVETPEWEEYIATNTLTPTVLYGEEFRAFLDETQSGFGEVLRSVGAIE